MTRAPLFAIASAIIATAAIVSVPGSAQTQRISARVNAPLKATPSPQGRILATVPKGSALTLDYCDQNSWCHVEYRNRTGWMAAVNLNLPAQHGWGTITQAATLRSGPGTQYKILGVLTPGTRLNVSGCQGSGWCQVNEGARRGWVARSLIDLGGNWTGPRPPLPGPGSRSELVMYTERNCRGNTYSTIESVPSMNYPVRSLQVRPGSGTGDASRDAWQICASTNYNGVCTSTTHSCSNLEGFNHSVRSVRRFSDVVGGGTPPGGICTKEYVPVCARAGRVDRTFGNACEARAAGYTVRYQGQCR